MATTAASYRNPQPRIEQKETNSSSERHPRDLAPVPAIPAATQCRALVSPDLDEPMTPGQVARTLKQLCSMGLVEKFRDEHNIVRYKPSNGRIA